jgi:hypothetical protein
MKKEKRKRTNNDWLMQRTGLLIVYAWVLLAVGFFVLTAWEPKYLDSSEDYVSILAIIGGPALLIVTKIIETWNQEKQNEISDYEAQAAHLRAMEEIMVRHKADMERNPHCHEETHDDSSMNVIVNEIESLREEIDDLRGDLKADKNSKKK